MEKRYYNAIMGDGENSFRNLFEKRWIEYIDHFPMEHKNARQLRIGNRLRPCMVCWGYALSTDDISEMDFEKIFDLAIGIELIHKGSIIIDDYLDDDSARRGEVTFHKQYTPNETIMFLLFLLGKAVEKLAKFVEVARVSNLICAMSESALRELRLAEGDFFGEEIDHIVSGETVALIKDSLLFGYETQNDRISEMNVILGNVATRCAYNFQLLNDLEPFATAEQNIANKKNHNFDFSKKRKNLIISRLYQECTPEDKALIQANIDSSELKDTLFNLIKKYCIEEAVFREINESKEEISKELKGLAVATNNSECLEDFLYFINSVMDVYYRRFERMDI